MKIRGRYYVTDLGFSRKGNRKFGIVAFYDVMPINGSSDDKLEWKNYYGLIVSPEGVIVYYEDDIEGSLQLILQMLS